jgi:hypothetical protein
LEAQRQTEAAAVGGQPPAVPKVAARYLAAIQPSSQGNLPALAKVDQDVRASC